jgi:hypothetical protein
MVRVVAYVLELETPPGENPEVQLEIRERPHTSGASSKRCPCASRY